MEFRILGPLEAWKGGAPVTLGGAKQRALLAILLLHANEVVSRDRLIDELWGEQPPASAPHSLDVYVSRLRKTLQPVTPPRRSPSASSRAGAWVRGERTGWCACLNCSKKN